MLRHIAKNIVANDLAQKCEIQIAYAIGIKEPVSLNIETYETNKTQEKRILEIVQTKFNLEPENIIKYLQLQKPIYATTTNYGHFGKKELTWEKIIKI